MTPNFPILRLPQVALSRIINLSHPHELVTLALCSKRAFNIMKAYRKQLKSTEIVLNCKTLTASITVGEYLHELIRVHCGFISLSPDEQPIDINFNRSKMYKIRDCWHIGYDCPQEGFRLVTDWVTELFRTEVTEIVIDKSRINFIDYVQNRQETLVSVVLDDEKTVFPEEDYQKILECKAQQVTLRGRLRYSTSAYPWMLPKRDALILTDAHWFTIYHLMASNFQHLEIDESHLTQCDLNLFLKHWLMGRKDRLKMLRIATIDEIELDAIFDGFHEKCHQFPEKRFFRYQSPTGVNFKLESIEWYIKRDDGILATVYLSTSETGCMFYIFVWPDDFGNMIKL